MSQELRLGTAPGWGAILRGERFGRGCWVAGANTGEHSHGHTRKWRGGSDYGRISRTGSHRGDTKKVIGRRSHFEKIQFMRTELMGIAKLWEDNNRVDQRHSVIN